VLGGYLLGLAGVTLLSPTSNGDYYQRIYSSIPSHNLIQFSFNLWAMDNWSTSGSFKLKFDSTTIAGFGLSQSSFTSNLCGASYKDFEPVLVMGTVVHSASALTLQVIHYLGQDSASASIAFRDLNLQFITADSSGLSTSICAKASISIPSGFECPCPTGQYKLSGVCTACDSSCASCYGGTSTQCYSCNSGYLFNGVECILCDAGCSFCYGTGYDECSECSDSYWMVGNHTCIPYCPSTLVVESTNRNCTSPCNSTAYIMWDGSCSAYCGSPLSAGTIYNTYLSCDFPCTSSSDYLYWNGTCASTCDSPLTSVIYKDRRFCEYSCTSASDYLYWNGSCISSCDPTVFSTRTEGGKKFCDFPCAADEHLYWNGSCISGACDAPLMERVEDTKMFCDYSCAASGEYLYWNGSCLSSCDSPLESYTEGGRDFCDFPCCSTQYLYWNGTCSNDCDSPLAARTEASRFFCDNSCAASGKYLYWNGSCLGSCASPLVQENINGVLYCLYPCTDNQYLLDNGTCSNTCDYPLIPETIDGQLYCDYSCASSEFLLWNGTCATSCDSPLVQRIEGTVQYCDSPCDYNAIYLYPNGSCYDSCDSPYSKAVIGNITYCEEPCLSTEFRLLNGTCATSCSSPYRVVAEDYGNACLGPCNTEYEFYDVLTGSCSSICAYTVTVVDRLYLTCTNSQSSSASGGSASATLVQEEVKMIKMLQYLCYLDIDYPSSLSVLSISHGRTFLSPIISFDMPDDLQDKFSLREIPTVFSRRGLHSSFLVNFWAEFMLFIVGGMVILIMILCEKIAKNKNNERALAVLAKLKTIIQWNLCIVAFAINLDNIILYSALDLMSSDFDSALAFSSLFVSLILVGLMAAFFIYTYVMVKRSGNNKIAPMISKTQSQLSFISRYPESQVIYRGFRDNTSRMSKHFYLVYSVRAAFPVLMGCVLYKYPLPQMIAQVVASFFVLLFVVWKKPIKSKINNIQLTILETLLFNVNLCGLILVTLSKKGESNSDMAEFFGDGIVLHNTWIDMLVLVFLVMKITIQVQEIYTLFKENKVQDRSIWCQLLVNFLQQGGFGFEKLTLDPHQGRRTQVMPRIMIPKMIPVVETRHDASLMKPSSPELPSAIRIEEQPYGEDETPPEILVPRPGMYIPTNDKTCASYLLRGGDRSSLIDPLGLNSPKDLDGSTLSHIPNSRRSMHSRSSIEKPFNHSPVVRNTEEFTGESPRLWLAPQSSPMLRIRRRNERLKTSLFLPSLNSPTTEDTPKSGRPGSEYDDSVTDRTLKDILKSKFEVEETNKKIFAKKRGLTIRTNGNNDSGIGSGPEQVIYEDKLDQILESAARNGIMDVDVEEI